MKYELDTIPIWDAYKEDTECPLCLLQEKAEAHYVKYFQGHSVMIPEIRVEVNKTGFCEAHYTQMYKSRENPLGLGLISHTYFEEQMKHLKKEHDRLRKIINKNAPRGEKFLKVSQILQDKLLESQHTCMVCDKIDYTLNRYKFTIVYLWKKNEEFKTEYLKSRGFCFKHYEKMISMAQDSLNKKLFGQWMADTMELQEKNWERLAGEVDWYTQKFDANNSQKPWGTSKDALPRTIQKLIGRTQKMD
ncbi:MAG: DUF6062 family protein [Spirochaetia bacterium]